MMTLLELLMYVMVKMEAWMQKRRVVIIVLFSVTVVQFSVTVQYTVQYAQYAVHMDVMSVHIHDMTSMWSMWNCTALNCTTV